MDATETEQDLRDERKVSALELIAERLDQTERIDQLEALLNRFVLLMGMPRSADEEWTALLEDVQEALGS